MNGKHDAPDKPEEAKRLWRAARAAHWLSLEFKNAHGSELAQMLSSTMKDVRDCAKAEAQRVNDKSRNHT